MEISLTKQRIYTPVRGVIVTVTDEFYHHSVDFEKSFRQMGAPMSENTWVKQMTEETTVTGTQKP